MKAKVAEIFKSIQGEGPYLGKEQIFLRFYGCNLKRCKFCDTTMNSFQEYRTEELLACLMSYADNCRSISLTGGEPLVQNDFLKIFLPVVKQNGFSLYLETNATLPDRMKDVVEYVDIIAMDFKAPSSTGLRHFWQEHEDFLRIAAVKEFFVKIVVCCSTDLSDIKSAIGLLSKIDKNVPLILQPNYDELGHPLMDKVQSFQRFALQFLSDVRIIPQIHKLVGVK